MRRERKRERNERRELGREREKGKKRREIKIKEARGRYIGVRIKFSHQVATGINASLILSSSPFSLASCANVKKGVNTASRESNVFFIFFIFGCLIY